MSSKNFVFIATSLDGYISDSKGKIDWLHSIPNPQGDDMGYADFISKIDAMIMGRNTFETVLQFGIPWPYTMPVFVLSNSLPSVPLELNEKVEIVNGKLEKILQSLHQKGHENIYIDGGKTIQAFLAEDLIDEMIITTIPILLGGGTPLFSTLSNPLNFECVESKRFLDKVGQSRYVRERK